MKKVVFFSGLMVAAILTACKAGSSPFSPTGRGEVTSNGLKLMVSTTGRDPGGLTFLISLKNEGTSTVALDFSSSQAFDIEVWTTGGTLVWTWSHDKYFLQCLWRLELKPGDADSHQADWDVMTNNGLPVQPRIYKAKVWITNYPADPRLSVEFMLTI